jgi:hypothetical protein
MAALESGYEQIDRRLSELRADVIAGFARIDSRFGNIDSRFGTFDARFSDLDRKIDGNFKTKESQRNSDRIARRCANRRARVFYWYDSASASGSVTGSISSGFDLRKP